ncbi:nicotinate-nucleotide--dimethylbenzimidazole phosphoribosyltransferase [Tepiditoga spiralis]|uniref:Nicotinate-nucleotide--dimethylbenzimidazole phosphoribosyltransferase n=1 Tax=Tepiditoga spiralis TaxID=2108365 RepID=A0A7G1G3T3_9BACT|nr:nicotinate-nucleotide--dimethylbenzimidazole phosphoribosyltransferase [Tepiditoga spiralis]BBE30715.1 nicotinate-nucleotide--dimethylbenzimidazole phosphoribosyltransferase [Tepiditoga spiralis]
MKEQIQKRLDSLTKPQGSLGKLEDIALKMGLIQGRIPKLPRKKAVYVFAGDHGVVEEDVSASPKEVTPQMVLNFLNGGAAINVFSRHTNSDVLVVDAGVNFYFKDNPGLIKKKVGYGTKNFTKERAMSIIEAKKSIEYGREIARHSIVNGVELAAIGDMGIGNTTTATAIACAFGIPLKDIIDIGTVITNEQLNNKKRAVEKAIELHKPFKDSIDVLSKVGSYCFGEMAGFLLECAENKIPVVLDGFPTTAAAMIAYKINPKIKNFIFAGHKSLVKGHSVILKSMELDPILDLNMRLGEGTGAVLSFSLIEAAIKMINEMETFESANVSKKE